MESFASRLKKIREERGYTQEQLAEISKISIGSIRRYEQSKNGSVPNAEYLLELAQVLDVTPEYLLKGVNDMNHYTTAIQNELSQITDLDKIKEIKNTELNSAILAHLELSDQLVDEIRNIWDMKRVFGTSYCTRNFVREIILRYCQNRAHFMAKFKLNDGMLN